MEKSRPSLRRKEDAASEAYGPFRLAGGKEKEKKKIKSPIATTLTPQQGTCQRQLDAMRVEGE
jgi:hypothetical protein